MWNEPLVRIAIYDLDVGIFAVIKNKKAVEPGGVLVMDGVQRR